MTYILDGASPAVFPLCYEAGIYELYIENSGSTISLKICCIYHLSGAYKVFFMEK